MADSEWVRGSSQYQRAAKQPASRAAERGRSSRTDPARRDLTGVTWDSEAVPFDVLILSSTDRVRARFRSQMPEFIWDAAALEGNPYTLPEVITLLDGTTVAGRRLQDQEQILALNEAHNDLDRMVAEREFALDKRTSDRLHGLVAVHEAIESGNFRGERAVMGGGTVSLGEHGHHLASEPGVGGETLLQEHANLVAYLATLTDARERALAYFAAATFRQFYFDGNKRTARLMMSGELMTNGYDAVSFSANRRLEYNTHLTTLFLSRDATDLMRFIVDNRPAS